MYVVVQRGEADCESTWYTCVSGKKVRICVRQKGKVVYYAIVQCAGSAKRGGSL